MNARVEQLLEKIRDSEAYQQLRTRYDELDSQAKLYVNLGAIAAIVLFVFLSMVIAMARLNAIKSEINDREETIGYLQRSADTIKQLQAQQRAGAGRTDTSAPLPMFVQSVLTSAGIDPAKADVGAEHPGAQDKETIETLLDLKVSQVNLRQIQRILFSLTDQGAARGLNIRDLTIDTKGDASGWMDLAATLSTFKAK